MSVTSEVRDRVFNSEFATKLSSGSGQVVCVLGEEIIPYCDEVRDLDKTTSRQRLHCFCAGAKNCFGAVVYVLFKTNDDNLQIIRSSDCEKQFAVKEYESPIKL